MSSTSTSTIVTVVVGVSTIIGTAGVMLWKIISESRQRMKLERQISSLDRSVIKLTAELEAAKLREKSSVKSSQSRSVRSFRTARSGRSSNYDSEDDEFYDFSSGGDDEISDGDVAKEVLSEELKDLFDTVDLLFQNDEGEKAYVTLKSNQTQYLPNVGVLWRLAKACHSMASSSESHGRKDEQKDFICEGLEFAKEALQLDYNEAEAHKWFAILTGVLGDFCGTKEKIEGGHVFKTHVEKAISLRPKDPTLWHLIGRFKFEVATLSWFERTAAGALYKEVPEVTLPEAMEDFKMASTLSPKPWKENLLYLAKCLIAQRNYCEAVRWLDDAVSIPAISYEDCRADLEVRQLLKAHGHRRDHNKFV